MAQLGRLPAVGDSVEVGGVRVVVLELEGRRASRVLVSHGLVIAAPKVEDAASPQSSADGEDRAS